MIPLPRQAKIVAEQLRLDVPRPKALPVYTGENVLRWIKSVYRPPTELGGEDYPINVATCPMGLHPEATAATPCDVGDWNIWEKIDTDPDFRYEWNRAIEVFAGWWDGLQADDAEEAMDVIWPKEQSHVEN